MPFGQEQRAFPWSFSQWAPAPQGLGSQGSRLKYFIKHDSLSYIKANLLKINIKFTVAINSPKFVQSFFLISRNVENIIEISRGFLSYLLWKQKNVFEYKSEISNSQ